MIHICMYQYGPTLKILSKKEIKLQKSVFTMVAYKTHAFTSLFVSVCIVRNRKG